MYKHCQIQNSIQPQPYLQLENTAVLSFWMLSMVPQPRCVLLHFQSTSFMDPSFTPSSYSYLPVFLSEHCASWMQRLYIIHVCLCSPCTAMWRFSHLQNIHRWEMNAMCFYSLPSGGHSCPRSYHFQQTTPTCYKNL